MHFKNKAISVCGFQQISSRNEALKNGRNDLLGAIKESHEVQQRENQIKNSLKKNLLTVLNIVSACNQFDASLLIRNSFIFNPLNPELNPICYLLASLAHHFLHVSRIRVKLLTFRLLMSYIYIYGAPILDVSRSHTTTQHSR